MIPFNNPATKKEVARLQAARATADRTAATAHEHLAAMRERAETLRTRIEQERQPIAAPRASTETLVAALVGDPDASLDDARFGAEIDDQVAARHADEVRKARLSVLEAALDKLDGPLTDATAAAAGADSAIDAARAELLKGIHRGYVEEFITRFAALEAEVIRPMMAIAEDSSLTNAGLDHFDTDSQVTFQVWTPSSRGDGSGEFKSHELLRLKWPVVDFGGGVKSEGQLRREAGEAMVVDLLEAAAAKR